MRCMGLSKHVPVPYGNYLSAADSKELIGYFFGTQFFLNTEHGSYS